MTPEGQHEASEPMKIDVSEGPPLGSFKAGELAAAAVASSLSGPPTGSYKAGQVPALGSELQGTSPPAGGLQSSSDPPRTGSKGTGSTTASTFVPAESAAPSAGLASRRAQMAPHASLARAFYDQPPTNTYDPFEPGLTKDVGAPPLSTLHLDSAQDSAEATQYYEMQVQAQMMMSQMAMSGGVPPSMQYPMFGGYGGWDPTMGGFFPGACGAPWANTYGAGGEANMMHAQASFCDKMADMLKSQASTIRAASSGGRPHGSGQHQAKGAGAAKQHASPASSSVGRATAEKEKREKEDVTQGHETTVMLKNIPQNYDRERLLNLLGGQGFGQSYDFVYLPVDFKKNQKLGYAFVNLISHEQALKFREHFSAQQAFTDWGFDELTDAQLKSAETRWGQLHDLQEHIKRYRNSPLMHHSVPEEYKPLVFEHGHQVPFPAPTERLQPPRAVKASAKASVSAAASK